MPKISRNAPCPCGSGKKYKHCHGAPEAEAASVEITTSSNEIRQIFFGEGQEAITDALIQELVAAGWSEKDVRAAQQAGAKYSRPRNSLIYPSERHGVFKQLESDSHE